MFVYSFCNAAFSDAYASGRGKDHCRRHKASANRACRLLQLACGNLQSSTPFPLHPNLLGLNGKGEHVYKQICRRTHPYRWVLRLFLSHKANLLLILFKNLFGFALNASHRLMQNIELKIKILHF